MLRYSEVRLGTLTIEQNGREFEIQIRQGNCLGVIATRREPLREFQPGDYVDWHGYNATVIDVDGDFITLDVCGEEVYTDTQELIQQQL